MKAVFVGAILAVSPSSQAAFFDGNKLLEGLRENDRVAADLVDAKPYTAGVFTGYVAAIYDAVDTDFGVCKPASNVTLGQLTDIVRRFLESRPEDRHNQASILIAAAFGEAFPCTASESREGAQ